MKRSLWVALLVAVVMTGAHAGESPGVLALPAQADADLDEADRLDDQADALARQRRGAEAQPLLERALAIRLRVLGENDADTAWSYSELATNLDAQRRYAEATPLHEKALAIRRKVLGEDDLETATSYEYLAFNLTLLHRYAEAAPYFVRAIEIRRRKAGPDDLSVATLCTSLAQNLDLQDRPSDAETYYRQALEIRRRALGEDDPRTADSYARLADNLAELDRRAEATPYYASALEIRRRRLGEQDVRTADTYYDAAVNLAAQRRFREAEPLHRRALEIRVAGLPPDDRRIPESYREVGNALYQLGRFGESGEMHRHALEIDRRLSGDRNLDTARDLNNLAASLSGQGRYVESGRLNEQALEVVRGLKGDDDVETATSYANLATDFVNQGRYAEALPLCERALEIRTRKLGEQHPTTVGNLHNVAYVLAQLGRDDEAAARYDRALQLERASLAADDPLIAFTSDQAGKNLLDLGRYADAEPLLQQGLAIRHRVFGDEHSLTATSYLHLSQLEAAQGRYPAAVDYARKARDIRQRATNANDPGLIPDYESLVFAELMADGSSAAAVADARVLASLLRARRSAAVSTSSGDADLVHSERQVSGSYRLVAEALWTGTPAAARGTVLDDAFQALQDSVASSAGRAVAEIGARFSSGSPALVQRARQRQDLVAEIGAVDQSFREALPLSGAEADETRHRLRSRSDALRAQLASLDADMGRDFPAYFELTRPDAMPLADAQRVLQGGEAVLLVVPGRRGTYVVAVTPTEARWFRADWTIADVEDAVRGLRCGLDAAHCARARTADDDRTRGARRTDAPKAGARRGFDRQAAYDLYRQVLAPAMPVLADTRVLYVVTQGALASLPFSVLVTEAPKAGEDDASPEVLRSTPWLLRRFALASLPSVASLRALRLYRTASTAAASATALDFVGFGDPVFAGNASASRGVVRASSLFRGISATGMGLADPETMRRAFDPLPGTRVELEAMRSAFAPRAEIHLGNDATERAVKHARLEGIPVIAFSTHGLIAGEIDGVAEPGLVFTPPARASAEDDGLLSATEVAQLHLRSDWVILSACNTASSDGAPGADALSGLARAFFYAGARSLLVSHWPVRDDVAPVLTVDAIRRLKANPRLGRAGALREATLAVLDSSATGSPALASPAAWAPFALVGDAQ